MPNHQQALDFIGAGADCKQQITDRPRVEVLTHPNFLFGNLQGTGKMQRRFDCPLGRAGQNRIDLDFLIGKPLAHKRGIALPSFIQGPIQVGKRGIIPTGFGMTEQIQGLHNNTPRRHTSSHN